VACYLVLWCVVSSYGDLSCLVVLYCLVTVARFGLGLGLGYIYSVRVVLSRLVLSRTFRW
jgi:hypothetical protein